jgi:hypothetical protein
MKSPFPFLVHRSISFIADTVPVCRIRRPLRKKAAESRSSTPDTTGSAVDVNWTMSACSPHLPTEVRALQAQQSASRDLFFPPFQVGTVRSAATGTSTNATVAILGAAPTPSVSNTTPLRALRPSSRRERKRTSVWISKNQNEMYKN